MATLAEVREIAMALPGVQERAGGHTGAPEWNVRRGSIAWVRGPTKTDLRTLAELGRSWPDGVVLGIRVADLQEKEALLAAEPDVLFTIPHFDGYPALLVMLDAIDRDRLEELICDAWLVRAPARERKTWLAERGLE
ncbi:MAG TPA: hypothetical protein VN035_07595 [Microbacterium sp.]|nr:hypothetical protein [Microbacterium sp.]